MHTNTHRLVRMPSITRQFMQLSELILLMVWHTMATITMATITMTTITTTTITTTTMAMITVTTMTMIITSRMCITTVRVPLRLGLW